MTTISSIYERQVITNTYDSCRCGGGFRSPLAGLGSIFGGFCGPIGNIVGSVFGAIPLFGGGSVAGGGATSASSYKGAASSSPYGSSVFSNNIFGKSKTVNLGGLGSYAKGDGGKAWNILGLASYSKSGKNSALDLSGAISALTGGLF